MRVFYQLPPNRLLKKDAEPPPTLRWWGGDCQATPYVRQSGPPPTRGRWRADVESCHSRSVITPPTQGWWRCSVVFQQPAKGRTTNKQTETQVQSITNSSIECASRRAASTRSGVAARLKMKPR